MITDQENKAIDEMVNRAIPKSTCKLTEAANIEFRKGLKGRIINLLMEREKNKPYQPDLKYKVNGQANLPKTVS